MATKKSKYRFDCNHFICRDCIIQDQAGHKFEFVKKSAPQYKKTLKESLAKIQTNISAATREVEKIEREVSEQLLQAQLNSHSSNFIKPCVREATAEPVN